MIIDMINDTPIIIFGALAPKSDHLKPSITPAIGFSPYINRYGPGIIDAEYTTGDANIHICIKNGTAYCISRYLAFNADVQSPIPSDVTRASNKNAGSQMMLSVGIIP